MGCDIYLHQEVKVNGEWHHYRDRSVPRSYKLFGLMAGVRGEGPAIAERRGIPADATFLTRYHHTNWDSDAHSASWLGSEEVGTLIKKFWREDPFEACDWFGYLFGNSWDGFHKYPDSRPEGLEDFRWIFWFVC